jgi:hypothetical protein
MRYLLPVPTGSEHACKTVFHVPDAQCSLHFGFACFSLVNREA